MIIFIVVMNSGIGLTPFLGFQAECPPLKQGNGVLWIICYINLTTQSLGLVQAEFKLRFISGPSKSVMDQT